MSATINTVLSSAVEAELGAGTASSYAPAISQIAATLAEREYTIVESIVETANERYGVSRREVAEILTAAGLESRPAPAPVVEEEPEAEATEDGKKSKAQRIKALEDGQNAILEALGSLTKNVADLGALAQRHLGASF